jgi:hypothetical protein
MTRRHQLAAMAVLGVSLMTAYAFGKGPFGIGDRVSPDPSAPCANGTCPQPAPTAPLVGALVGAPRNPSSPASPYPSAIATTPPTTSYHSIPYGIPVPVSAVPNADVEITATLAARELPSGHWKRAFGPMSVELQSRNGLLEGKVAMPVEDGVAMNITFVAECSMTRDGQLYGVVQSADLDIPNLPADTDLEEILGLKMMATTFIDQPLAIRCRIDGDKLTIKTFNVALPLNKEMLDGIDAETLLHMQAMFVGRYDSVPQPAVQPAGYRSAY